MTLHSTDLHGFSVDPAPQSASSSKFASDSLYSRVTKRAIDCILILLAAPVVVPIVLLAALFVSLDGGSPFYIQRRVGQGGRIFRMWKLRSMVKDADARLESHLAENPEARKEWDATQKLKKDPRITRFGRLIRKSSLDELPQLWNVLKGDMSLVGPRPMMVSQRDLYHGQSYFRLKPGITGFWQISDRNECRFRDRVRFDDAYEAAVSFKTDVTVLLRTVMVVIRGTGY